MSTQKLVVGTVGGMQGGDVIPLAQPRLPGIVRNPTGQLAKLSQRTMGADRPASPKSDRPLSWATTTAQRDTGP